MNRHPSIISFHQLVKWGALYFTQYKYDPKERNAWFQTSHSEKNLKVLSKLEGRLLKMRAEMKSSESEFVQNLLFKPIEPSISFGQPAQADILVSIVDYEESDFERLDQKAFV